MIKKNQKVYSRGEVEKATLEYFNGDKLSADVWINKYCFKDSNNNYFELTPDDMHQRLSKEFARIEKKYKNPLNEDEIFDLFKDFKYILPQGRVMAGLGVYESYRSLSNCLVLPSPNDSYSSIMFTDTMLVNAAKRGCGYGIDLSNLRPIKSEVKNAANTSTGIIPFMERYSNSTREVGQDNRRGACLLGLDISHPESLEFAKSKTDRIKITGANISLKIGDNFLESVENNSNYDLKFNGRVYDIVNANEYWKKIINVVRDTSEPGIFFWDRIRFI
jgi:ribonucleoside-diphosphate reductase alpha chain